MSKLTNQTRRILKSSSGEVKAVTKTVRHESSDIEYDPTKKVKVISLGGLFEIGKNTWVFECGDDIMLVDAGLAFPTTDMIGVDIVLPRLNYIVENKDKIRAMIVTHGHEDHIGGIVPMLRELHIPIIYAPGLAYALVQNKLREANIVNQKLVWTKSRDKVQVGQYFSVQYVRNNHSIADSFCLIIDTPAGRIVHSGDFKFDHSPVENQYFDIRSLAKVGEEGVDLLISDSTNAERAGYTPSEKAVIPKIKELIFNSNKKLLITTFASQVSRVKLVLQLALQANKKVSIFGRSMINLANISRELGYISIPDNFIVKQEEINKIPPEDLVILTTGSQGEQFAALSRIARGEHKYVKIQPGDQVLVSASPIPGNERSVNNLINNLFARGADVIYGKDHVIHVSGHASQDEQKMLINLCNPVNFMPCHGEYRMLLKHGETSVKCGVDPDKIFVMDNGDVLEMQDGVCKVQDRVDAGILLIDNDNVGRLDDDIILERRMILSDGFILVIANINAYGKFCVKPEIETKGILLPNGYDEHSFRKELIELCGKAEEAMEATLEGGTVKNVEKYSVKLKTLISHNIYSFLDNSARRYPLLEVMVLSNSGAVNASVAGL